MSHIWKVVPISPGQRKDVREEDLIEDGLFRRCDVYRGGGGYDLFPTIFNHYYGFLVRNQFIVQLYGCNLDCPYCYVTRAGVWGSATPLPSEALVAAYLRAKESHQCEVFHLMGGAPALQMRHWPELISALIGEPFHSDLMLSESEYDLNVLRQLASPCCLYAVNIKGVTPEEHLYNTRKPLNQARLWRNLHKLEAANVPYYFTFTNIEMPNREEFLSEFQSRFGRSKNNYVIDLKPYEALVHVDDVPWGKQA